MTKRPPVNISRPPRYCAWCDVRVGYAANRLYCDRLECQRIADRKRRAARRAKR